MKACNSLQQQIITNRIKELLSLDMKNKTKFHAQQWEDVIRTSLITCYNIIPINYYNVLVKRVVFVSLKMSMYG